MSKKALITGIAGQDGSYLAEFLLKKNYDVYGVVRNLKNKKDLWRISSIIDEVEIFECDVSNQNNIKNVITSVAPDEIYHLASFVEPRIVFEKERSIFNVNFFGAYNILRAVKENKYNTRIFLAGSSLMFGDVDFSPQNEETPFNPNTPYGIAKTTAFRFGKMYRNVYNVFVSNGILFNHESPRRDEFFLPRKITRSVGKIKAGLENKLELGNIDSMRDWSFAGDIVEAMWLSLQAKEAEDYVIGSGELHSVKDILEIAFSYANLNWEDFVVTNNDLKRSVENINLCADTKKIKARLGWQPKISFKNLVEMMVDHDIKSF